MDRRTAAGSDIIQFSLSALTLERRVTTNACAAMVSEAPVYLITNKQKLFHFGLRVDAHA